MIDRAEGSPLANTAHQAARRRRFFWAVLIFSTLTSIAGNVTHAVISAKGHPDVAVGVAVMPPVFLLLATESVGLLVRSTQSDRLNKFAVVLTVAVTSMIAVFAFRLSFDALKELAIGAGVRSGIAWLWPLSVDLSIGQATLALMTLDRSQTRSPAQSAPPDTAVRNTRGSTPSTTYPSFADDTASGDSGSPDMIHQRPDRIPDTADTLAHGSNIKAISRFHRTDDTDGDVSDAATVAGVDSAHHDGWVDVAQTLIREKVTVKPVEQTAQVLRLWDQRVPTTTIATRTGVHRDTVTNIVRAAESLMAGADRMRA
ncbi:DUF2637 domain-containing protein [Candidatus Mycobacterium methanotrophicum]|uniref:DUF2637 domain-containing protein n=3 Tax=Candidatus Mycobacterium methanotrophicum TaxID=2943498 RepID=A0ABY4QRX3_9MYCO|nr:DUF2637 domain-containing protein [Candidatus Mycobacterium methanotrophicum]UQX13421.1 DUF2637 domain-containing protein [Candidatus Mycobacterium methanotrophicum]